MTLVGTRMFLAGESTCWTSECTAPSHEESFVALIVSRQNTVNLSSFNEDGPLPTASLYVDPSRFTAQYD